jgi:DeoR family myo-inositol catabolism operon transcriptional repressor
MKSGRIKNIEKYIHDNGNVDLDVLCKEFSVSKNTIRRDIGELVKSGSIKKVYGGVTSNGKKIVPFEERNIKNISEKILIAKNAAKYVEDGDIIFIDSGTTTVNMVEFLKDRKNVIIITNNLNIIFNAIPYSNLQIISLGGNLIRNTNSFACLETATFFENFNINKAFMAATGISITKGVTNYAHFEYQIKKTAVETSDEIFLLADYSKFNTSSLITYCNLNDINHVITDKVPPHEYVEYFQKHNIKITI